LPGLWFHFFNRTATTNSLQIPISLNITPILQFVTYSILNTPINCWWQDLIEASFPSNVRRDVKVQNKTDEKATALKTEQVFSVKNTIIKFFLDQTIGAAVNIPLFIGIIGMVKGQSLDTITNNVKAVSSGMEKERCSDIC
jgi:protein Mpv17